MKKKICLLAMLAVVTVSGVVCEEVNTGPVKEAGIFNRWEYYTGKKDTSSYKLDWDAFYERMDKISKNKEYSYIFVATVTAEPKTRNMLAFSISAASPDMLVKMAVFEYQKKSGQTLVMIFSSMPDYTMSNFYYYSYSAEVDAWNDYLEYM